MAAGDVLSTERLIQIGREVIARSEHVSGLEVKSSRMVSAAHVPVVYGLMQHCLRLGSVTLDLHERGLRLEAMPLVRAQYETAITAQWAADSREGLFALFNEDIRQRKQLSETMARSASQAFREYADKLPHLD